MSVSDKPNDYASSLPPPPHGEWKVEIVRPFLPGTIEYEIFKALVLAHAKHAELFQDVEEANTPDDLTNLDG